MALRIGQGQAASKPAVMEEEPDLSEVPVEAPVEEVAVEEPVEMTGTAKASPEAARYLMPEYRCGSCVHFLDGGGDVGECELVAGAIHPEGSCSLYEPDAEMLAPDEPMMEAEAPVAEEPVEEEV